MFIMNVFYMIALSIVNLIHELLFDMYIYFYNYITFNNLIHKQHVTYI